MAGTTLKIEGTEVAPGGSGGTVINLTLHQESGLAYLCKGAATLLGRRAAAEDAAKDAAGAAPARRPRGGEQAALGGAQILLGAVCIGLGVVLSFAPTPRDLDYDYDYYQRVFFNGVPFWMGSQFILSGTFSVVGARRSGNWVHLATFLNLGSVVAGSVAYTLGLTDFLSPAYQPGFVENLCKRREEDRGYRYWQATTRPPYDDSRDQERAKQCQAALWALARMWSVTQILLLILHTVALAITLFGVGYGLCRLCRPCREACKDYVATEEADAPLVPEEPGKEQNPA